MTWGFFSLPSPFSVSVLQPVLQPFPFCLLYNYSTHFKMFTIFVCHHVVYFPQKLWDPLKVEDVIPVPTFLNQSLEGLPFTQKYSSMPAFPRHSPLMNSTIVWLQTLSLRSSMWSSTALLRSSVNEWNAFMTRRIAWGPGGHTRFYLLFNQHRSFFFRTGIPPAWRINHSDLPPFYFPLFLHTQYSSLQ